MGCASSQSHTKPKNQLNTQSNLNISQNNQKNVHLQQQKNYKENGFQIGSAPNNLSQQKYTDKISKQNNPVNLQNNNHTKIQENPIQKVNSSQQHNFQRDLSEQFKKVQNQNNTITGKIKNDKNSILKQKIKIETGLDHIEQLSKSSQFKQNNPSHQNTPTHSKHQINQLERSNHSMINHGNNGMIKQTITHQKQKQLSHSYNNQPGERNLLEVGNISGIGMIHQSQIRIKTSESASNHDNLENVSGVYDIHDECYGTLEEERIFFGEGFKTQALVIDMNAVAW